MVRITHTVRCAALALGLLGSAVLSGMGPLGAHAAQSHSIRNTGPYIQAAAGNCSVTITGSNFTPNGAVDLFVSQSGDNSGSYEVTLTASRGLFWPGYGFVGAGKITWSTSTNIQTIETVQVQAYDVSSQQWSNTTISNLYCLG